MSSDTLSVEPDFPFLLKAQRLSEELDFAQKKLREYEDLCTCYTLVVLRGLLVNPGSPRLCFSSEGTESR